MGVWRLCWPLSRRLLPVVIPPTSPARRPQGCPSLLAMRVLRNKSDVPSAVQEVLAKMETQTGKPLRSVQTDRGREYVNVKLRVFFLCGQGG